jgi:Cft2 family RNA processing exonuclease
MNNSIPPSSNEELCCFPYGVGHGDEGVCLLIKIGPYKIMLDCGLEDLTPLINQQDPPCDLVFCSHAHRDHGWGLWEFHQAFPQIPIYGSEVTSQLLPLNWLDKPTETTSFCQALPWRYPIEFQDGLTAELFPAGHLPGAAAILLTYGGFYQTYRLLYTGDFFLSNSKLVEGLPLDILRTSHPDVLILEGTYGTTRYPHRRQQENRLMERIHQAICQQQSVLLAAPPLGLSQELLILLRSHHLFTGKDLDIWVEHTIAEGCDAYIKLLDTFPTSVQNFARHQALFWDDKVKPYVKRWPPEELENYRHPSIILIDRWTDWLEEIIDDQWLVLVPSHDRTWIQLTQSTTLQVETYILAEHGDGAATTQLIHNLRPKHVVFVHGSPTYLNDLTALEELQSRYHLHSPSAQTLVELPIGDTFVQPLPPIDSNYEGELTELDRVINILLPDTITSDPRWHNFADTGLIEARWQGEDIVLRSISQRELINQTQQVKYNAAVKCCNNCSYQKINRCDNLHSPLYGFKVSPEGYCPHFQWRDHT